MRGRCLSLLRAWYGQPVYCFVSSTDASAQRGHFLGMIRRFREPAKSAWAAGAEGQLTGPYECPGYFSLQAGGGAAGMSELLFALRESGSSMARDGSLTYSYRDRSTQGARVRKFTVGTFVVVTRLTRSIQSLGVVPFYRVRLRLFSV